MSKVKIGQTIYVVYRSSLYKQKVYMVGKESFAHDDTFNTYIYEDYKGMEDDIGSGKVVAKFTLNKVEEIERYINLSNANLYCFKTKSMLNDELCEKSCLTTDKLDIYLNGGSGYAIHISDLEIFDKPKELSEFKTRHYPQFAGMVRNKTHYETRQLTKAPQSWCYVENL